MGWADDMTPNQRRAWGRTSGGLGSDAWHAGDNNSGAPHGTLVCSYPYTDAEGSEIARHLRYDNPKDFRWTVGTKAGELPLYRLPEVLAAVRDQRCVWLVEGEEDADAIREFGECATTAAGPFWKPHLTDALRGAREVRIVRDRDENGRGYEIAAERLRALRDAGIEVRVFDPVVGKDVSDHLAAGRPLDGLVPIELDDATRDDKALRIAYGYDPALLQAKQWLYQYRIPIGGVTLLVGPGDVGKGTYGTGHLIPEITRGTLEGTFYGEPQRVLVIADEDDWHEDWVPRLVAGGADLELVAHLPEGEYLDDLARQADRLRDRCKADGIKAVWFDQLLDHMDGGRDGSGIYNPKVVRDALRPLRRAAREGDFAPVCTLHPNKNAASFDQLVSGSVQFGALARAALILLPDPSDEAGERRIVVRGKGKAPAVPSHTFKIVSKDVEVGGYEFEVPAITEWTEDPRRLSDLLAERAKPAQARRAATAAELAPVIAGRATPEWQWLREQPGWPAERPDRDALVQALRQHAGITVDFVTGRGYRFCKQPFEEPEF
jgi:hypothetical protein